MLPTQLTMTVFPKAADSIRAGVLQRCWHRPIVRVVQDRVLCMRWYVVQLSRSTGMVKRSEYSLIGLKDSCGDVRRPDGDSDGCALGVVDGIADAGACVGGTDGFPVGDFEGTWLVGAEDVGVAVGGDEGKEDSRESWGSLRRPDGDSEGRVVGHVDGTAVVKLCVGDSDTFPVGDVEDTWLVGDEDA